MNYFGSNPRILYVAAVGLCFLILYGTHQIVRVQLSSREDRTAPAAPITDTGSRNKSEPASVSSPAPTKPAKVANAPRFDERAWVTVKTAKLTKMLAMNETPVVAIEVENGGKTPASDLRIAGNVVSRRELTPDLLSDKITGEERSTLVLGPGVSVFSTLDSTEPVARQGQIDAWLSGQWTLFASGIINYKDVSGVAHRTQFCFRISGPDLPLTNLPTGGWAMAACVTGNKVD